MSARVRLGRSDEFGRLANELNDMGERLSWVLSNPMPDTEQSSPAAIEVAAVAEPATSTATTSEPVHAFIPPELRLQLQQKIKVIRAELHGALQEVITKPITELEGATRELAKDSLSAERRAQVSYGLVRAGNSIGDSVRKLIGKIVVINQRMVSLESIISEIDDGYSTNKISRPPADSN